MLVINDYQIDLMINGDYKRILPNNVREFEISNQDIEDYSSYLLIKVDNKFIERITDSNKEEVNIGQAKLELFGKIAFESIKLNLIENGKIIYPKEIKDQILSTSEAIAINPLEAAQFAKEIVDFVYGFILDQVGQLIAEWTPKTE